MITYGDVVVTINLALMAVYFYRKELWNAKQKERDRDVWAVLDLIKGWYESGRTQHKEANIAKEVALSVAATSAANLEAKVEAVPERTADLVTQRIQGAGDSGIIK